MMAQNKRLRIGDLLLQKGVIDEVQLQNALNQQKASGRRLGQTLLDLGMVDEEELLTILSEQLQIPFIQLSKFQFDDEVTTLLPETAARRYRAIVLSNNHGRPLVGMLDPLDIFAYDELVKVLNSPFDMAVVRESELLASLDQVYSNKTEISEFAEQLDDQLEHDAYDLATLSEGTTDDEAPVVKLLESVFEDAVISRASDIHIEPDESVMRIRQRVDGVLHEHVINEKRISAAVVLRLKLMCGLNISEKRLPQDGRFSIRVNNHNIDVRLSTLPVQFGESVVMRLLDQTAGILDLSATGMSADLLERFRQLIHRPHGLVLVTGPTGSGKTTTLYGALNEINKPGVKIITAEDPVEYTLPRLTQVQINQKIGLDFGTVLRSCLRQDPDIMLVGEMRDTETAEIGLRAALTGHLVLSTLHTNDAVSSAMRLIDMGIEPYLVASALTGILAQRLIRKVCEHCKEPYELSARDRMWLRALQGNDDGEFYIGSGCYQCGNTGFHGRMGVYELLEFNEEMLDALRVNDQAELEHVVARDESFKPLAMQALVAAHDGRTSLSEVFRISADNLDEGAVETPPEGVAGTD